MADEEMIPEEYIRETAQHYGRSICQWYADGTFERERTVALLSDWPYTEKPEEIGSFDSVVNWAFREGLIDRDMHMDILLKVMNVRD